jgi:hypothetical protein
MMFTILMPTSVTTANVVVNGKVAGTIAEVTASAPFEGFDGETHVGTRWLPEGVRTDVMGPVTRTEAALLLLALGGYDEDESMKALRLGPYRVAASGEYAGAP